MFQIINGNLKLQNEYKIENSLILAKELKIEIKTRI
jgi:hypothetical protein